MFAGLIARYITPNLLWILVGLLVVATAAAGGQTLRLAWLQTDIAAAEAQTAKAATKASEEARAKESAWQSTLTKVRDEKDAEIRSVAAARDAALASLRDRPRRLPEAARTACKGATGAELSDRDSAFLTGLAARADELRAELAACYGREDALSR